MLVVEASGDFPIVYANPAYLTASGYSADQVVGTSWLRFAAADEGSSELADLQDAIRAFDPVVLSLPVLCRDGEFWRTQCRLIPLESQAEGKRCILIEHLSDAVESVDFGAPGSTAAARKRRAVAGTERLDPLTGLLSDQEFRLMLRRDIAIARRNGTSVHLMLFSISEFDVYRATFGSNAADSCLRMIGAQIAGTFRRASDLSARIGDSMLAVSVVGQDDGQVSQLVEKIESKARSLGLHNPRGRYGRHIVVYGAMVEVSSDGDDLDAAMERCRRLLSARCGMESVPAIGSA